MNYQTQPLTMWFDRRLILRRSPIHGIGTFATHAIEAGALLMLVTGSLIIRAGDQQTEQLYNWRQNCIIKIRSLTGCRL
jgi:SET domain-containing protein